MHTNKSATVKTVICVANKGAQRHIELEYVFKQRAQKRKDNKKVKRSKHDPHQSDGV